MAVYYEWDVEERRSDDGPNWEKDEITEHTHSAKFKECMADLARFEADPEPGHHYLVVLVRDDDVGRSWAEMDEGKLPAYFHNADGVDVHAVPQRFVNEVAAYAASLKKED